MSIYISIEEMCDTATFDELVSTNLAPIIETKSGYNRFMCVKRSDFSQWGQTEARAHLLKRIMISEHERAENKNTNAFEATEYLKEKYGI